jgi:hypothetical protein
MAFIIQNIKPACDFSPERGGNDPFLPVIKYFHHRFHANNFSSFNSDKFLFERI